MAHILSSKFLPFNPLLHYFPHSFSLPYLKPHNSAIVSTVSSPKQKSRRGRKPKEQHISVASSAAEKNLRLVFMEELMIRARNRDSVGVSDVIYDMIVAGLVVLLLVLGLTMVWLLLMFLMMMKKAL